MTKMDKLIFWGLLAISFLFLVFSNIIFAKSGQKTVVIEAGGEYHASYRLEELKEPKHLALSTKFGTHEIELTRQYAKLIKSDCKDGYCLGKIQYPGEMLVCLPGHLVMRIESSGEVDGVAY